MKAMLFHSCSKATLIVLALLSFASCVKEKPDAQEMPKIINTVSEAHSEEILINTDAVATKAMADNVPGVIEIQPVFSHFGNPEAAARYGLDKWYKVSLEEGTDLQEAAEMFAAMKEVKTVQFNTLLEASAKLIPADETDSATGDAQSSHFNDPMLGDQWNFLNTGAFPNAREGADIAVVDAWRMCTGDPRVTVAIIDSGIKNIHSDLDGNIWKNEAEVNGTPGVDDDNNGYIDDKYGYNFIKNNGSINWSAAGEGAPGHGTHVAGIIAAENNNGRGICGIAGGSGNNDGVRLMSCQIYHGSSTPGLSDIAKAFIYAADNGAAIASCSFGYKGGKYNCDKEYYEGAAIEYDAIKYFISPENANCDAVDGNIVVFSAGNDGYHTAGYPAAAKEVIAVTAIGPDFRPTFYTNHGPGCNIAAPGGDYYLSNKYEGMILSTIPSELSSDNISHASSKEYGYMQGTSQACPHVAGVAALGMSYALQLGNRSFTRDEFISMLLTSVNDIDQYMSGTKPGMNAPVNLSDYIGKMGSGAVDAWQFLMAVEGVPSHVVQTGSGIVKIPLEKWFGESHKRLTYTEVTADEATKLSLGMSQDPRIEDGCLVVECNKVGAGKISISAIAGGNNIGNDDQMGGREVTREISILSRKTVSKNFGWL